MEKQGRTWALWSLFSCSLLACRATIFSCFLLFLSGQSWGRRWDRFSTALHLIAAWQIAAQTFQLDAVLSFSSSPEDGSREEGSQEAGLVQNKQKHNKENELGFNLFYQHGSTVLFTENLQVQIPKLGIWEQIKISSASGCFVPGNIFMYVVLC